MSTPKNDSLLRPIEDFPRWDDADDDLEDAKSILRGEKFNPNHEPAGDEHGGEFAESPGGAATAVEDGDLPPAALPPLGPRAPKAVPEWLKKMGWDVDFDANAREWFEKATPEQRKVGEEWYAVANAEAADMAEEFGVTREQAAGVIAALSPNSAWPTNLANARTLLKFATDKTITIDKGEVDGRRDNVMAEAAKLPTAKRVAAEAKASAQYEMIRPYIGTHPTEDVPIEVIARFAHIQQYPDNTEKALRIIRGESPNSVLYEGGAGFKVRSFYSNIVAPKRSQEATIDTHMLRALTNDMSISPGQVGVVTGNAARYTAFRQPILDLAKAEGLAPHQVQAIIWTVINDATGTRDVGGWATKAVITEAGREVEDSEYVTMLLWQGYSPAEAERMLTQQQGRSDDMRAALDVMRGEKFNPNHEPAGSPEGGQFAESPGRPTTGMDALTIEEKRRYGQIVGQEWGEPEGEIIRRDDGVAIVRVQNLASGTTSDIELTARGLWSREFPSKEVLATHVALSDAYDETVFGPLDAEGPADLTDEQFARYDALRRYAGSNESIQLNARLRQKDRLTDEQRKWRDALDGVIATTPLPQDVKVYRGISITDYAMVPGTTLTDRGYMSTTLDETHAAMAAQKLHGGRALLEFTVPKGSDGVYLASPAGRNYRESEYELLLPRGMKLRIIEHTTRDIDASDPETGFRKPFTYDVYRAEVVQ